MNDNFDLPEFDEPMPEDMVDRIWNNLKSEIDKRIQKQLRYISVLDQIGDNEPDLAYAPIASELHANGLYISNIHWN